MGDRLRLAVIGGAAVLALASAFAVYAAGSRGAESGGAAPSRAASQEPVGRGAMRNAEAIAEQFGVSAQDVAGLREQGFGFGAIVKLLTLAKAKGVSAASLAASIPLVNGERKADFGAMFEALTDQERARVEGVPKNLGQIKRAQNAKAKTR